jgi:chemotaxis protein CheD
VFIKSDYMSDLIVGISDIKFSKNADDVIITYALGSCIGIVVFDPIAKVGGMLHYMLPESILDQNKARENPEMFADTGIPLLFKSCYNLGAEKKRMVVKVAGGASILDDTNFFRIGQKNIMAMRKIFWKNNVMINKEDTGLNYNRTVRLEMSTGKVFVRTSGGEMKEL